ncbi:MULTISPECIES: hypothetical protein [Levilactobacillus]
MLAIFYLQSAFVWIVVGYYPVDQLGLLPCPSPTVAIVKGDLLTN